jgi:hypothetical protein
VFPTEWGRIVDSGIFRTFAELEKQAGKIQGITPATRLLAILFMRKGQEITDKLIVPSLNYFHIRSGEALHFIMPGWIRKGDSLAKSAGEVWVYDDVLFERARAVIASETNWKYSGGTDLLLITTRRAATDNVVLNFSAAINIRLHELQEKGLVGSPEIIFERLIRFAENYKGPEPLLHLSLQEVRVSLFEGVVNSILSYISKEMKDRIEYGKHFLVQDVSKEERSGLALVKYHVR